MRLSPLRVPVVVAAVLLPRGRRVDVLPVLIGLSLALPLPLRFAYRFPVGVIVAIVVAEGVPVGVIAERVPVDVVVVSAR